MVSWWVILKPVKLSSFFGATLIAGLLQSSLAFADCMPSEAQNVAINSTAEATGLRPDLLHAIASVESCYGKYRYNARTKDYGLMQINIKTALSLGYSTERLMHDDAYALQAAAKVLKGLKRGYPRTYACRYNAGTGRSPATVSVCDAYMLKLVKAGYKPAK